MKTIVMIPTYNERENIGRLVRALFDLKIKGLDVLVVDDNSPDGTAAVVSGIRKASLLLRKKDKGRGYAGIAGYRECLKRKADYIIEMDADFSHDPKYIPKMLEMIKHYDVVLGSRAVAGGRDVGRGLIRQTITKLANFYIRVMFGVSVKDCNSGFRCFRADVIRSIVDELSSEGPDIVQEVLYKVSRKGFSIGEIPIVFVDRELGSSKLRLRDLMKGYTTVLKLRLGLR